MISKIYITDRFSIFIKFSSLRVFTFSFFTFSCSLDFAKLVSQPQAYRWSSFRAYLMCDKYVWLNTEAILSKFGNTKQESIENLLNYTLMKVEAKLDKEDILRAHKKGVFGDDEGLLSADKAVVILKESRDLPSASDFMNLVCERLNVTREELSSRSKSITAVDGRSVIALIARKYQCWPLQEVAAQMNKSSGTISRLAARGESNENLVALARTLYAELTQ